MKQNIKFRYTVGTGTEQISTYAGFAKQGVQMDSEGEDEQMALAIAQSLELNYNQQIATAANPKLKRKGREGKLKKKYLLRSYKNR